MTTKHKNPLIGQWNQERGKPKPGRDTDKDHSGPSLLAMLRRMDRHERAKLVADWQETYLIALDARHTATGKARTLATMDAAALSARLKIAERI